MRNHTIFNLPHIAYDAYIFMLNVVKPLGVSILFPSYRWPNTNLVPDARNSVLSSWSRGSKRLTKK